jgi:hypothetical protein
LTSKPAYVDDEGNIVEAPPQSWWDRHWLKVCLAALFFWTSLGFYLGANERTDRIDQSLAFSKDLRQGLVRSCDKNGNPLREAVQRILTREIEQSKQPFVYEILDKLPRAAVDKLVADQNKERREIIAEIEPIDCAKQYPHVER